MYCHKRLVTDPCDYIKGDVNAAGPALQVPGGFGCRLLRCSAAEHPGSPAQQLTGSWVGLRPCSIVSIRCPGCSCCLSSSASIGRAYCRLRSGNGSWVCTAVAVGSQTSRRGCRRLRGGTSLL
jgi:hypothetical protein